MSQRPVTEHDFRMPQFRNAKPEDYEFRGDGKIVRKDRWEMAVQSIRFLVGIETPEFEIEEVIERVRAMASQGEWALEEDDTLCSGIPVDIQLIDGSVLCKASYDKSSQRFFWVATQGSILIDWADIEGWRPAKEVEET